MPKQSIIKKLPKTTTCNFILVILLIIIIFNVFFGSSDLAKNLFGSTFKEGLVKQPKKKT